MCEVKVQQSCLFDEGNEGFVLELLVKCHVTAKLRDVVLKIVSLRVLRIVVAIYPWIQSKSNQLCLDLEFYLNRESS